MPWHNGDYPPSYMNKPKQGRDKAVEIANEKVKTRASFFNLTDEGIYCWLVKIISSSVQD